MRLRRVMSRMMPTECQARPILAAAREISTGNSEPSLRSAVISRVLPTAPPVPLRWNSAKAARCSAWYFSGTRALCRFLPIISAADQPNMRSAAAFQ